MDEMVHLACGAFSGQEVVMTDQVLRPDGTGFHLAGGELTFAGVAAPTVGLLVDVSVTARLLGSAGIDVTLASWSTDDLGDARSEDGRTVLPLQTQPILLTSLPSNVRVQLRTTAQPSEGDWQLVLRFRNHAGSSLTWHST